MRTPSRIGVGVALCHFAFSCASGVTPLSPFDAGPPRDGGTDAGTRGADGGVDGGADAGPPVSYGIQVQSTWDNYCTGCHGGPTPAGGLDLTTGNSWAALVDVPTQCDAGIRVVPFDAGASMLWLKLTNSPLKCGASEPQGQPPLAGGSLAQINGWIEQGALQN